MEKSSNVKCSLFPFGFVVGCSISCDFIVEILEYSGCKLCFILKEPTRVECSALLEGELTKGRTICVLQSTAWESCSATLCLATLLR